VVESRWEDFKMIEHLSGRIDDGWLQLWLVDSVDAESFYDKERPWPERAARHLAYERYLIDELLHALALATRRPSIVRKAVGLSGAYDSARWLDGAREGDACFDWPYWKEMVDAFL